MHHNVLRDVVMHYSQAVMFHVFPIKRGEKTWQSSPGSLTLHTSLTHVEKSGTHRLKWEEGEKGNYA